MRVSDYREVMQSLHGDAPERHRRREAAAREAAARPSPKEGPRHKALRERATDLYFVAARAPGVSTLHLASDVLDYELPPESLAALNESRAASAALAACPFTE